jgi:hypothetical protein
MLHLARTLFTDPRFHSPLLITGILVVAHMAAGVLESPARTALAVVASIATELVAGRIALGAWPHPAGAWMTGTSVGMMLRSPAYWPFAYCAVISILSKYVIRLDGRHIWNPSNFGVSFVLFVYPAYAAHLSVQWGNSLWSNAMVWGLGSLVILRLRLGHICLAYVAAYLLMAGPRSWITGHAYLTEVASITGPMHQLFVLLMITDPKTSVRTWGGRMAMVATVAVVEAVFRCLPTLAPSSPLALDVAIHAPFYALFVVGPSFLTAEIAAARSGGPAARSTCVAHATLPTLAR